MDQLLHKANEPTFCWLTEKTNSTWADYWFALPFILEAFMIFPLDIVLLVFAIARPQRTIFYTLTATCCSTFGALLGYTFGACAWQTLAAPFLTMFISPHLLDKIISLYQQSHKSIILIGGLLPLPFKAFTLPAGFCNIPLLSFLLCIFTTRFIRYSLIGYSGYRWGGIALHHITKFLSLKRCGWYTFRLGIIFGFAKVLML